MKSNEGEVKQSWEPMKLSSMGNIGLVIEVSKGKITPEAVDEGDRPNTKPKGQG